MQQPYQTSYPPYPQQPSPQGYNQGYNQSQPTAYGNPQMYPGQPYPTSQVYFLFIFCYLIIW